jgi:hypothetical protein
MSTTIDAIPLTYERAQSQAEAIWPVYAVLFASISIVTGLIWDISWHRSIGRDSFWSPPHVLEQVAALVAGLSCGWVVLRTTFGGSEAARARSVTLWGFRGPLGGWVCIWGALMMISSAPFDNWWHNAYGLDVKIMSPPHMVLAWGMIAIEVGAILTALARQNRATAADAKALGLLYALSAGILLTMHATVLMEYAAFPNQMHSQGFYRVTAIGFPLILAATSRPARMRWPATTIAAIYMGIVLLLMWTLQLFPATPKLAPIYNTVTHMVPPPFPLLIIVPAFGFDLLVRRFKGSDWLLAPVLGVSFVALMMLAHWWFAEFLLTPHARNYVFAADQWTYYFRMDQWRYDFWDTDAGAPLRFWRGIGSAALTAMLTARLGLWIGSGMARVQR